MLASMSEIDPRADTPLVDWSNLDVSGLLPTGTVTLLLADVEGSTRLWETGPEGIAGASDAVGAALQLQRAPLAPIRLRIGVHTGEVQLRDEGNYAGSTINRTARLRDLAHGGQTVLSGATGPPGLGRLTAGAGA